jgi:hypothetical protein
MLFLQSFILLFLALFSLVPLISQKTIPNRYFEKSKLLSTNAYLLERSSSKTCLAAENYREAIENLNIAAFLQATSSINRISSVALKHAYFRSPPQCLANISHTTKDLTSALSVSPNSSRALLFAANTAISLGDKKTALTFFSKAEDLTPQFSTEKRLLVLSFVETLEELTLALPKKFSNLILWNKLLEESRKNDYQKFQVILAKAILVALTGKEKPRLSDTWTIMQSKLITLNDKVRQKLDSELCTSLLESSLKEKKLSSQTDLFCARKTLKRINSPLWGSSQDYTPERASKITWENPLSETPASLTKLGQSIAISLPRATEVFIYLQSNQKNPFLDTKNLRFFVKQKDLTFAQTQNCKLLKDTFLFSNQILYFSCKNLSDLEAIDLKIAYKSDFRSKQFHGPLFRLLQAYY